MVCTCIFKRCLCPKPDDSLRYARLEEGRGDPRNRKAGASGAKPGPGSPLSPSSKQMLLKSPEDVRRVEAQQAKARKEALAAAEEMSLSAGMSAALTASAVQNAAIEADRLAAAARIREYNKMMKAYEEQANSYDPNRPMHTQVKDPLPSFSKPAVVTPAAKPESAASPNGEVVVAGSTPPSTTDITGQCNIYPYAAGLPGVGTISQRDASSSGDATKAGASGGRRGWGFRRSPKSTK